MDVGRKEGEKPKDNQVSSMTGDFKRLGFEIEISRFKSYFHNLLAA